MQHRLNAHIGPNRERIVFCEICSKADPDLNTECSKIINVGKVKPLDTNTKLS
jgi:hypothetical protein